MTRIAILNMDVVDALKHLPDNSVDTIITDPPYGLEFMGKEWDTFKSKGRGDGWQIAGKPSMEKFNGKNDWHSKPRPVFRGHTKEHWINYQHWTEAWAREALRVAKHGATMLVFGGTRTFHRLACGLEDAGWIIKDTLMWMYSTGFPKATDISKQIDKKFGQQKEKEWQGYKSHSLKPAYEPIIMAMKPNEGSYADNALKWGVAGLNIDAGRIPAGTEHFRGNVGKKVSDSVWKEKSGFGKPFKATDSPLGRFPANIILDEEVAKLLDEQSGVSKSTGGRIGKKEKSNIDFGLSGDYQRGDPGFGDKGGASRFFYVAKASKRERNMGLEKFKPKIRNDGRNEKLKSGDVPQNRSNNPKQNFHPTVKPLKLMEYLVKLTSMPSKDQVYLDPFLGSGTTLMAVKKLGRNGIGIEKNPEYVVIARARIKAVYVEKKLWDYKNGR